MCKLTNEQMLRYFIFKDCGFDEEIAKKSYDFVMDNKPKPESKPATELADGIYLMYEKHAVLFTGQEVSAQGCTGVGVKFGGKSLVLEQHTVQRGQCVGFVPRPWLRGQPH